MENDSNEKNNMSMKVKILVPSIIAVIVLIVLVTGASYAYINYVSIEGFQTFYISGTIPDYGTVTMNPTNDLTMELTRLQVISSAKGDYYATPDGVTSNSDMQVIGTATVEGAGTFECTYDLNIKAKGDLFTNAKGIGKDLLTLEVASGDTPVKTYDFSNGENLEVSNDEGLISNIMSENGDTLTGLKLTGLKTGVNGFVKARLKYTNSDSADQGALQNTNGTVEFSIDNFKCTAVE